MAFSVAVDSVTQSSVGSATFHGSWNGADVSCGPNVPGVYFQWGYNETGFIFTDGFFQGQASSGAWSRGVSVSPDRNAKVRSVGQDCSVGKQSANTQFKTLAGAGSFPSGLTPSGATQTTVNCSGSVIPNTDSLGRGSTCSVTIQFRVLGTSVWSETAAVATGLLGTSPIGIGGGISGLLPNTTYEARYKGSRDTANAQTFFSPIGVFTTLADTAAKTIVVPAPMEGRGSLPPATVGPSNVTIVAPVMEGSGRLPVPDNIESPELTTRVEVDVFVASRIRLNVFV